MALLKDVCKAIFKWKLLNDDDDDGSDDYDSADDYGDESDGA